MADSTTQSAAASNAKAQRGKAPVASQPVQPSESLQPSEPVQPAETLQPAADSMEDKPNANEARDELIRQAAYRRYEARGGLAGDDIQDWLEAEAEIDEAATVK